MPQTTVVGENSLTTTSSDPVQPCANKTVPQPHNLTVPSDTIQPHENKSAPHVPNPNNMLLQLILWLAITQIIIIELLVVWVIWACVAQQNALALILVPNIVVFVGLLKAWIDLLKAWVSNRLK